MARDLGFWGAVIGLVVSLIQFVVLVGLSIWIERTGRERQWRWCSPCLLRLVALLGLTFGFGVGYLIGRSMMGR